MRNNKLELLVTAQERKSFDYNIQAIYSFIANHENIPAKLVASLLKQILPKEDFDLSEHYLKAKEKVKHVLEFIKLNPKYQLNWEFKELKSSNKKTYDFSRFALVMLHAFFQYEAEFDFQRKKDKVIQFFYLAFLEDVEADLSILPKEKVSAYKLKVMAGVFTKAAGYPITNKKNQNPKDIYLAVQHAIKKI
jgi:hypothetical protein